MDLGKLISGVAGLINPTNAIYNKITTGEFAPGIDVGAGVSQLSGQGDRDIIEGLSVAGGDRNPINGSFIGQTDTGNNANDTALPFIDGSTNVEGTSASNIAANTASSNASGERSYYQDQIDALNQLLGYTGTQRQAGLNSLTESAANAKRQAQEGYDLQRTQNNQNKLRGIESVGDFANTSYNNLNRLLRGANAGRSSVARELIPQLIAKSAGQRRQGVFDTAGQNAQTLDQSQNEQFNTLENQRKSAEQSFLEGILGKENDLLSQRRTAEIQQAMANGTGYETARNAAAGTQASINDRMSQLSSLFGQYKPNYSVAKTPDLSTYTVDKANISTNNNMPVESSFYLNQLKKKQELGQ